MLRAIWLAVLVLVAIPAWPGAAQEYQSSELAEAASAYRRLLIDSVAAARRQPALIPRLRRDAEAEYRAKRYDRAIDDLKLAIASGADDGLVWLRLAQALAAASAQKVQASAYNAYVKSSDPVERGNALFLIARDYDRHDKFKEALAVFQAGLGFVQSAAAAERVEQLRRLVAFRVTKVELAAESDAPRVCLRMNEKIATKSDLAYGDFVRAVPDLAGIVTARGDTLCLDGLKHGETYAIELLQGFPAATGEKTIESWKTRIVVPDRKPAISFAGAGYVLPREGSAGLPVTTINVDKVKLRLVRVNERNLVPSINADKLTMSFDRYNVDELISQDGSLVWDGEMTIAGERNRPVITAIPLHEVLRDKGPGVYLAAVNRADTKRGGDSQTATNWVLVSNLGLATYSGSDGMAVAVRSLADAKPIAGVALKLYARNNGELASATTDAAGVAHIPGAKLRGRGGDEPFALVANGPANGPNSGDFNFLEIGRGAFDLSDRGVSGRAQPGPVDAFLYSERGIYRPGERVHLTALVRDDKADAAAGLPVTLRLLRPDGVEAERRQLTGDKLGGHATDFALARDARIGTWRAELRLDPKAPALGSIEFRVEDFVPPTLKVELAAPDQPIRPAAPFPVEVAANYYYGAPGAGLSIEAQATIEPDDSPFPDFADFRFGLVDEQFTAIRQDIDTPTTDDDGKATVAFTLPDLPDGTRPLAATIQISVFEPSGRAIGDSITRPIRSRKLAIGLRSAAGDDAVPDGQPASLDIIALDGDGKRVAAQGLRWELLRERWEYSWYSLDGRWRHRSQVRDQPIAAGALDIAAATPANLSRTLPAGRYRWEIADPATGAQTSLRFTVGWYVEAALPDVPDKLSVMLDKTTYQPGDTAKLFVKAQFAGEAELAIASDRVLALRSVTLPAEGATIEIPVEAGWGGGVYALVSGYRPQPASGAAAGRGAPRGPGRAVGVAWLGIDPTPRTLSVALTGPAVARPRGPLDIPVKVSGLAAGEEAYLTLAAVDEAVLKLTEFPTPAPEKYYYGRRRLGVELRDVYGRLIDAHANSVGALRSGGDQFAKRAVAGLPDRSSRVVALYSGIVKLDGDGAATVRFEVPDFQGQLRLMAVAYSAKKVGSAAGAVTVRDPVVTMVSLPRFLAPGDTAQIGLVINNLEGPSGDYRLKFAASGAGAFATPVERAIPLGPGQGFTGAFPVSATTPGNIALRLELTGPNDLRIARDFTVGVRPAQAYQLRRFVARLEPGQRVILDDGAADEFLPGTAEGLLTVSPRPDWDVPGLLRQLNRYAYGCIEQTISRAMPLLYVDAVAQLWRTDPGFSAAATLDGAIGRVVGMQRLDGSFGVWSDSDDTVPWLDAYAADFLLRAKEHGKTVPDHALTAALGWLRDYVRQQPRNERSLPAAAYAHYVLARAKMGELPALRYFADTQLHNLPTQLARAQLAAALAAYGDMPRAAAAYDAALGPLPKRPPGLRYVDYGSDLRDSAGVVAFAGDNNALHPRLTAVMDRIAELFARSRRTSTQEQAWLLMAAEAAVRASGGEMTVGIGTADPQKRTEPVYFRRQLGSGAAPVSVANRGTGPAWRTVSLTGVPKADLPAENSGYWVGRWIFRPDGTPADLTKVKQTDLFVVVIKGVRNDPARAARTLVVDLLPAGFEIQSTLTGGESSTQYPWLKRSTEAAYTEARDDRYIAALDLGDGVGAFSLAYVVRAITPGEFKHPAVVVEDMYEPETTGRTAIGSLTVLGR
jgi:uncharacterized protein YfaS (alpha-2-macroglobulin family)